MAATSPRCAERRPGISLQAALTALDRGTTPRSVAKCGHPVLARAAAPFSITAVLAPALAATVVLTAAPAFALAVTLRDEPVVWWDDDTTSIAEPMEREPNINWDSVEDTVLLPVGRFFDPVRFVRRLGTAAGGDHVQAADDVNALGEVVNSTWFTNRIGLFPLTEAEVARGPGRGRGPDESGPWTIVSAKTEGVTPGFNIRDAQGAVYLVKFDPPGHLGMTTCAGVVSARILHAAGYNVPEDATVTFERSDLVLGENVRIKLPDGSRRSMTDADIDAILDSVDRLEDGRWFAITSRFLSGTPVGPFDYRGRRRDDPNDRIPHEDRRSLRGLEVFASWLNHFDTKQHNSLDMYVEEEGRRFVRHYLIDFASTLGSGAKGPQPRHGYEYTVDLPAIGSRLLSFGFHESVWRTRTRPEGLEQVGYLDAESYDPIEFKPMQPNSAFANCTDDDLYWAAKIITAFTDEHLAAIVATAGYEPAAATYVAERLAERRDAIGRTAFTEVPPLDFFRLEDDGIVFRDLGDERGIYPGTSPTYRMRWAWVDEEGRAANWSPWTEAAVPALRLGGIRPDDPRRPFVACEVQVRRTDSWSRTVRAFFAPASGRTLAMER